MTFLLLPPLTNLLLPDLRAKGWLREWLLDQLKMDRLQQRMYSNISTPHGLLKPPKDTWEDKASRYWDVDHASDCETGYNDGDNHGDVDTQTRATSPGPGVDGSFPPLTQLDRHGPQFLSSLHHMGVKVVGESNITQPRETSYPSPTSQLGSLSSSPALAIIAAHSIGPRGHSSFSQPRKEVASLRPDQPGKEWEKSTTEDTLDSSSRAVFASVGRPFESRK